MPSNTSFPRQIIGLLILSSIISLFLLCVVDPFMATDNMNQKADCGMAHNAALCPMALSGRLGFWQQITLPTSSPFEALALLAFLAAVAFFWNSAAIFEALQSKFKLTDPPSFFDYLGQQFSQGILHPKIY